MIHIYSFLYLDLILSLSGVIKPIYIYVEREREKKDILKWTNKMLMCSNWYTFKSNFNC
jgi:hypothetical protein